MNKLLLIGGSNIDYIGTSDDKLKDKVSNPGIISTSFGGVMRNICEDLVRLNNKCIFITAIGNDTNGLLLKDNLIKELDVEVYTPSSIYPSSSYMAINDEKHDMALAICDGRILADLNKEYLSSLKDLISSKEYVALDSNLFSDAIDYLLSSFKNVKFICEGISPAKVVRYKNNLSNIYLLKCNIHEAQALVDEKLYEEKLIKKLFSLGLKNVVVTNGPKKIYFGVNGETIDSIEVGEQTDIVNTTGCGDAMFAGIVDYINQGKSLKEAIIFGCKLSALTLRTTKACSEKLSMYAYDHEV